LALHLSSLILILGKILIHILFRAATVSRDVWVIPSRFPPIPAFDTVTTHDDLAAVMDLEGWTNDRLVGPRMSRLPRTEWVYGSGPMLGWLVDRDINPHIPVLDKLGRTDGTWSRTDFAWDPENNQYNRVLDLRDNEPIQLAYCWAHARRKLYELTHNNVAPIAEAGLNKITALYRIEAQTRGKPAQERLAIRKQKSAPKIAAFKTWLDQARTQVSAKTPTGEALKYIAKYWDGPILFLTDGRIEMDSNAVERTIRPIALQRKNALFAGHDAGAQNWAMLASLIETCKLNQIEPYGYLTDVLTAIVNGHKQKDIEQLLPWNFKG